MKIYDKDFQRVYLSMYMIKMCILQLGDGLTDKYNILTFYKVHINLLQPFVGESTC